METTKLMTWEQTKKTFKHGHEKNVMYADFAKGVPVLVWILVHNTHSNYNAIETIPATDRVTPNFNWCLVEAMSVSYQNDGLSVTFWNQGSTGFYPSGNGRLPYDETVIASAEAKHEAWLTKLARVHLQDGF